jgi:hypothetical protein
VEPMGFEPTTSSMPSRRAPNCATAPHGGNNTKNYSQRNGFGQFNTFFPQPLHTRNAATFPIHPNLLSSARQQTSNSVSSSPQVMRITVEESF